MKGWPEIPEVDARVIQAERSLLVLKYEACFRRIYRYIRRANKNDSIGIPEMFEHIVDELEKVYPAKQ